MPSTHHLAVPKQQQQSLDAALPFLFQIAKAGNKQFYTTYGLVACLGRVKEEEITFYAIDRALLRAIRAFINRPAITIDNVQEQVKQARELDSLLVEERGRISKLMQSLWFYERGKRRYIIKWKQMIKAQQAQLYKHIRLLQQAANYVLTGQPLSVEIVPIKTVFRALNSHLVEVPNALLSFLPSNKRKWFHSSNSAEVINFIMSKHALFQPLHLSFNHPKLEQQAIDARLKALRFEMQQTSLAIKNSGLFAFRWRAFLRTWQQVVKLGIHEVEKGQHTWQERLTMRQNLQLEQFKTEIQQQVFTFINTEPDDYAESSAETIRQAQVRLQEVEHILVSKEHALTAYEQQSVSLDANTLESLKAFISTLRDEITCRKKRFSDRLVLFAKRDELGTLPNFIEDPLQTLELTNFDQHSYLSDLKRYELKWNLLQRQVDNAPSFAEVGFSCEESLMAWQQLLNARHHEFTQARVNIVWLMAEKIYSGQKSDKAQQQKLLALMELIKAAALPGELSSLQTNNMATLKQHLQTLAGESPVPDVTLQWEAKVKDAFSREMQLAQALLATLAKGEQVLDVATTQWLCRFYCKVVQNKGLNHVELGNDYHQQINTLQQTLTTILQEAEKVCEQRLYNLNHGDKILRLDALLDPRHLPEVLCFGLLCQLGEEELHTRQHKLVQHYLKQSLHAITSFSQLSQADTAKLEAFETVILTLEDSAAAKLQTLSQARKAQNWVDYQTSCRQWLALLTQPPVATLTGQGVLSPKSRDTTTSHKKTVRFKLESSNEKP